MAEHVYKMIELTGSSTKSADDAIRNAISRAGKTVRSMRWFEVVEIRGSIDGSNVNEFQVKLKIGFTLEG